MDWQKELFKEKNLGDVYKSARQFSFSSKDNWMLIVFLIFLFVIVVTWWFFHETTNPSASIMRTTRAMADAGVAFSTSILGFLIAGFAIFSSVTKPDLFIALANIPYKKNSDISRLKYVFFNFLIVFIHYLGFMALCLFTDIFLSEGMPLTKLIGQLTAENLTVRYLIASAGLIVVGVWFASILLLLKGFIWNLYQSVLLAIATEEEMRKAEVRDEN